MSTQPFCRYCGKAIAKRTTRVYFVTELSEYNRRENATSSWSQYIAAQPTTKTEAQRLVNKQIVSVKYHFSDNGVISSAGVWDGESYVDPHFCNDKHAVAFARAVVNWEPEKGTQAWANAVRAARD